MPPSFASQEADPGRLAGFNVDPTTMQRAQVVDAAVSLIVSAPDFMSVGGQVVGGEAYNDFQAI